MDMIDVILVCDDTDAKRRNLVLPDIPGFAEAVDDEGGPVRRLCSTDDPSADVELSEIGENEGSLDLFLDTHLSEAGFYNSLVPGKQKSVIAASTPSAVKVAIGAANHCRAEGVRTWLKIYELRSSETGGDLWSPVDW